jgi:hypothetical protein
MSEIIETPLFIDDSPNLIRGGASWGRSARRPSRSLPWGAVWQPSGMSRSGAHLSETCR